MHINAWPLPPSYNVHSMRGIYSAALGAPWKRSQLMGFPSCLARKTDTSVDVVRMAALSVILLDAKCSIIFCFLIHNNPSLRMSIYYTFQCARQPRPMHWCAICLQWNQSFFTCAPSCRYTCCTKHSFMLCICVVSCNNIFLVVVVLCVFIYRPRV